MTDTSQLWIQAMRAGRYEEAWRLSDATLRSRDPATRDDPSRPYHERWVWDGRSFDGRHVLVRCYHGLGDTIQFVRFLPQLATRAATVTLEVQPSLIPLMDKLEGLTCVMPFDPAAPLPPAECDLEITELPLALRMAPSAAPAPYLSTSKAILSEGTIALCHAGGDWDRDRSLPPRLLEPLCSLAPCVTLVPGPTDLPVLNPGGCPMDMEATAAIIAGASLVITVDTMAAHLAGALGVPTFLMLKAEPDWRWSPGQTTSPWYSSMRLYAQPTSGDWPAVVGSILADLETRTLMKKG
jgi:hypothetical protein